MTQSDRDSRRLLAIDIGNTSVAIGVFDGDELAATFRIATDQENLPDEYGVLLSGLVQSRGIEPDSIDAAILSCTVPPLIGTFQQVCLDYFGCEALVVGPGVKTGVRVLYDNPREVGPDRILHAVAALDRYDPPLIIVDLGTALVFDAYDRNRATGNFILVDPGTYFTAGAGMITGPVSGAAPDVAAPLTAAERLAQAARRAGSDEEAVEAVRRALEEILT